MSSRETAVKTMLRSDDRQQKQMQKKKIARLPWRRLESWRQEPLGGNYHAFSGFLSKKTYKMCLKAAKDGVKSWILRCVEKGRTGSPKRRLASLLLPIVVVVFVASCKHILYFS